jgi:hypothetical protein
MYTLIVVIVIVIMVVLIAITINYVNLMRRQNRLESPPPHLVRFDNSTTPLIEPPAEIVIEGNERECHKTLTPCTTHADCDVCREGLANCQYFDEDTVIATLNNNDNNDDDNKTITIRAGESYCLALSRERARSCNPNTGVWLLAETVQGNFALLCNCLRPGLVTQLTMYDDCTTAVGCAPHGNIANVNESPLRCVCDEGYESDYNASTETPFCRARTVRDVMYNEAFFPVAPCADGQVRLDHPALNPVYRQHFRLNNICVVDPCSVDPVSGRRTAGRLFHLEIAEGVEVNGCNCPASDGLVAVHNRHTADTGMVRQSAVRAPNACLQPFNVHVSALRHADYKFFWGRTDQATAADADLVFQVHRTQVSDERYLAMLYPILTSHPDTVQINFAGMGVMKFSIAFDTTLKPDGLSPSFFVLFKNKERNTNEPACFFPGTGRCIVANSESCIRRHGNPQVWTAETFTGSWCVLSRDSGAIRIWSPASRYPFGEAPVSLRVREFFLTNNRQQNTVRPISVSATVTGGQVNALTQTLDTYPNYSI